MPLLLPHRCDVIDVLSVCLQAERQKQEVVERRGPLGARQVQGGGAGAQEPRGADRNLWLRHPKWRRPRRPRVQTAEAQVSGVSAER